MRRWWFWLLVLVSASPYVFWGFLLFLQTRLGREVQDVLFGTDEAHRFALVFYNAYQGSLFWIMVLALTMGAPSVAADNRTNALQVYLSKPITKADYLLGKWASVFVVVAAAMLLPSIALFFYCVLSFWSDGFVVHEPWLLLKIVAASAVTAGALAAVFVGVSAWCRSTLVAAAAAAGLYLGSQIAARVLWVVLHFREVAAGNLAAGVLVQHASVGGVISGLVWNVYGVTVRAPIRPGLPGASASMSPPELWIMLTAYAAIFFIGLAAAYVRVRAVEVVAS